MKELGRVRQGTGREEEDMIWGLWRQTTKMKKTSPLNKYLFRLHQHCQEMHTQSGDQEVTTLLNSRSGYSIDLSAPLSQAAYLAALQIFTIFCKLIDEVVLVSR